MLIFRNEIGGFFCQMFCFGANDGVDQSGVGAIDNFFQVVVKQQHVRGVVFRYDYYAKASVVKTIIDSHNSAHFLKCLFLGITKYQRCLLRLESGTDMNLLLKYYERDGQEDDLSGEKYRDAIGGEIQLPDGFLDETKLFLMVYHDGSSLCLIKRKREMGEDVVK